MEPTGEAAMTTRTATCACGRLELTVAGEPKLVLVCHCDFCQKRSGSVFIAGAHFSEDQVLARRGATSIYNGLVVDGEGAAGVPGGIDYHFCPTCGSTMFWEMVSPLDGTRNVVIAVGNFVDPDFPVPTTELFTKFRHHWVVPIPGAMDVRDPLDGSVPLDEMVPSLAPDPDPDAG
jgi:hypothetical protein